MKRISRRAVVASAASAAIGLAAAAGATLRSTRRVQAATPPPPVLVCLGDSLTAGVYLSEPSVQTWPARLQATLPGWTVVNAGIPGNTVIAPPPAGQQTMTDRFASDVLNVPNVAGVIIFGGINDCGNVSATTLASALESLFWQAYNAGLQTYLCTLSPMLTSYPYYAGIEPDRESVNAWMRSYFGTIPQPPVRSGVFDLDAALRTSTSDTLDQLFSIETIDGLHNNWAGHVRIADTARPYFS